VEAEIEKLYPMYLYTQTTFPLLEQKIPEIKWFDFAKLSLKTIMSK